MDSKTITMRLTKSVYEQLCRLADEKGELPTETARRLMREKLAENVKIIVAEVIKI